MDPAAIIKGLERLGVIQKVESEQGPAIQDAEVVDSE